MGLVWYQITYLSKDLLYWCNSYDQFIKYWAKYFNNFRGQGAGWILKSYQGHLLPWLEWHYNQALTAFYLSWDYTYLQIPLKRAINTIVNEACEESRYVYEYLDHVVEVYQEISQWFSDFYAMHTTFYLSMGMFKWRHI